MPRKNETERHEEALDERGQRRFRQLINDLGAELGQQHGWRATVARSLSMNPTHLSRIMNNPDRIVGRETLLRVASQLGFAPIYYESERGTFRDFYAGQALAESYATIGVEVPRARALLDLAHKVLTSFDSDGAPAFDAADRLADVLLAFPATVAARKYRAAKTPEKRAYYAAMMSQLLQASLLPRPDYDTHPPR